MIRSAVGIGILRADHQRAQHDTADLPPRRREHPRPQGVPPTDAHRGQQPEQNGKQQGIDRQRRRKPQLRPRSEGIPTS